MTGRRHLKLLTILALVLPLGTASSGAASTFDPRAYSATECRIHGFEAFDDVLDTHGSGSAIKNIGSTTAGVMCPLVQEAVFSSGGTPLSNDVSTFLYMSYDAAMVYKETCTVYSRVIGSSAFVAVSGTYHTLSSGQASYGMYLTSTPPGPSSRAILCWLPAGQSLFGYLSWETS